MRAVFFVFFRKKATFTFIHNCIQTKCNLLMSKYRSKYSHPLERGCSFKKVWHSILKARHSKDLASAPSTSTASFKVNFFWAQQVALCKNARRFLKQGQIWRKKTLHSQWFTMQPSSARYISTEKRSFWASAASHATQHSFENVLFFWGNVYIYIYIYI